MSKNEETNKSIDISGIRSMSSGNIANLLDQLSQVHPQTVHEEPNEGPVPMRFVVSQGKGSVKTIPNAPKIATNGMLFIGKSPPHDGIFVDPVSPEKENLEDFEAVVRVVLVEAMTLHGYPRADGNAHVKGYRFPQRMLKTDDNGKNLDPPQDACKSRNGIHPEMGFIGDEIYLQDRGVSIKIGYAINESSGELEPVKDVIYVDGNEYPDICGNCPANIFRPGKDGKPRRMCDPQPVYILYVLPFVRGDDETFSGGLVEVFASNTSLSTAFMGTKAGSYGSLTTGEGLIGIEQFYNTVKDTRGIIMPIDQVRNAHLPHVVALSPKESKNPEEDFVTLLDILENGESLTSEKLQELSDNYGWAIVTVQTFLGYPEGRPEIIGTDAVIKPVVVTTEFNSLQDGQTNYSPVFNLGDSLDEYDAVSFIQNMTEYYKHIPSHREWRMGLASNTMEVFEEMTEASGMGAKDGAAILGNSSARRVGEQHSDIEI